MTRLLGLCASLALLSIGAAGISAQQLTPTWVELGEGGTAIARVVIAADSACPSININGVNHPMEERRPIPSNFRPVCEAGIPNNTKFASVNAQVLALPKHNPSIVVAFGDTGCRIKGSEVQACKDPAKWPFEQVAANAAAEKPNLMIDVGDYVYREIPCPIGSEAKCGGTPVGDNWEAWKIDFFTPAAKLLTAAPWAFARGNHESCGRSWRGWFYYLDPRPWTETCEQYSPPYVIKLGSFELVMLDSSEAAEDSLDDKQASIYAAQLAAIHARNAWLVVHHPFWGFKAGALGKPSVPVSPLEEAWNAASPKGIRLILSGHIHLFELTILDHARPAQVVAGGGGTNLALPISAALNGTVVRGSMVVASQSQHQFGYTVLDKIGNTWRLTLKNQRQNVLLSCALLGQVRGWSAVKITNQEQGPNCGGD